MRKKETAVSCDLCMYYSYDEEYDCFTCEVGDWMDEDDVWHMMSEGSKSCPYFRMDDEYQIVKKQM